MLNSKTFGVAVSCAVATFAVASAFMPAAGHADTSNTANTVAPNQTIPSIPSVNTPRFPPRRAPLAPPAVNDVSRAYGFRTQLLGNPQCQRFATESDSVFLDGTLDDAQKADKLKALGAEAKANDCLAPAAY